MFELCMKRFQNAILKLKDSKFLSICHNDCWLHNILYSKNLLNTLDKLKEKPFEEVVFEIGHPRWKYNGLKLLDFEYISYGLYNKTQNIYS